MHAFILAGGFATRLWPLTEKRAKPLLPLAGKPIIDYCIEDLPDDIAVSVSTNAAFEEGFLRWRQRHERNDIRIVVERTESDDQKLGALGALAQWVREHEIDEDILLLTGDNYFGFRMHDFLDTYRDGNALIAAYDIGEREKAKAFGTVLLNDDGTVSGFEEKPREPKTTLVSTGCSILPRSVLPILLEFAQEQPDNVGGIFEELLRRNKRIDCFSFDQPWFDIGSFHAYLDATVTLVGGNVHLGPSSVLERSETSGCLVTGANCSITDSRLRNVVLFDDCDIHDCDLEDCIIDNGCIIRGVDLRGKMLREGTSLTRPST